MGNHCTLLESRLLGWENPQLQPQNSEQLIQMCSLRRVPGIPCISRDFQPYYACRSYETTATYSQRFSPGLQPASKQCQVQLLVAALTDHELVGQILQVIITCTCFEMPSLFSNHLTADSSRRNIVSINRELMPAQALSTAKRKRRLYSQP